MFFKRGNINKAISATMLLMLLFIHSVKLLHSHPPVFSHAACKNIVSDLNDNTEKATSPDCSVCSYQLGKDTDNTDLYVFKDLKLEHNILKEQITCSYNDPFSDCFDSRGPPQL